jgi:excisionase family DNA binding protein
MTPQSTPRLLGRSEVAALLGISRQTLDRLVKAGSLPVVRLDRRPRFLPEDVDAFVRSRRKTP